MYVLTVFVMKRISATLSVAADMIAPCSIVEHSLSIPHKVSKCWGGCIDDREIHKSENKNGHCNSLELKYYDKNTLFSISLHIFI